MATIYRRGDKWRAQVRRDGKAISETFDTKSAAQRWARDREVELDRGENTPTQLRTTFGDIVDIYLESIKGKQFGEGKMRVIDRLKRMLGDKRLSELTKRVFLDHAQTRENEGAGPPALLTEFSYLNVVLKYGGLASDMDEHTAVAQAQLAGARTVLAHAGRLRVSKERERRPTLQELEQLAEYFHARPRISTPMWDMILFAIATAMRVGEIVRIVWEDFDEETRTILVRDRKDPKKKEGNSMRVPLLSGPFTYKGEVIDPVTIMKRQRTAILQKGRIFPIRDKTVTQAFGTATDFLGIDDLTFHDFRHDAVSRLFEAGYKIEEVALVSGHKSWKNLQRYTHLRPQSLHR